MTAVEAVTPRKLLPWSDRDLIYVRGYVIDRRTGEVISSLVADRLRELKG